MSHIVKISIEIKDLDALAAAARALGLELMRNQRTYKHYGAGEEQDGLPEGFTVRKTWVSAIMRCASRASRQLARITKLARLASPSGAMVDRALSCWPICLSMGRLPEYVGANAERLKQNYSSEVAKRTLQKQGYRVQSTTKPDGRIVLQATR